MVTVITLVLIGALVIHFMIEDKKSSIEYYKNRLDELNKKNSSLREWVRILEKSKEDNTSLKAEVSQLQDKLNVKVKRIEELESKIPKTVNRKRSKRGPVEVVTEEMRARAIAFIEGKSKLLGREVTLEDLVTESIARNGKTNTENLFNGMLGVMEAAGKDTSEADTIFDKYFNDF